MEIQYTDDFSHNKIEFYAAGNNKNYKNKDFALLGGYEKTCDSKQRTWRVLRAVAATSFFGLGLFSEKIRSDLGLLFKDKEIVLVYSSHPSVLAANGGEASAQFKLAEMLYNRTEEKKSLYGASVYYARAAKKGHEEAKAKLEKIFENVQAKIELSEKTKRTDEILVKAGVAPQGSLSTSDNVSKIFRQFPFLKAGISGYIDKINDEDKCVNKLLARVKKF